MTKTFDIAHIKEGHRDIIIVPFQSPEFDALPDAEKRQIRAGLALYAQLAGLKGELALAWLCAGEIRFLAPGLEEVLQSKDWALVLRQLNGTLECTTEESRWVDRTFAKHSPYSGDKPDQAANDQSK